MFEHIVIFGIIPFLLALCGQGRRSLSAIAVCLFAVIGYGLYQPQKNFADAIVRALFLLAAVSSVCGVLTSAVTLVMRSRGAAIRRRMIAVAVGMLMVPTAVFAPIAFRAWDNRPPSSECNYSIVTFSLAGHDFVVPGIEIVSATLGDGRPGLGDPRQESYSFYGNASLRRFCDTFDNGDKLAAVNAVRIRLSDSPRYVKSPRFGPLCRRAAWPEEVCSGKMLSQPGELPQSLTLYDSASYRAGLSSSYDDVKRKMAAVGKASDIPGFSFDGHNYLWVDSYADPETGVPFALKCFKSGFNPYCTIDDPVLGTVRITYGGLVRLSSPVEDARQMRRQVRLLMTKIRQP